MLLFVESPREGSIPSLTACPCGGTGRHAGLKILFAEKASAGSIPAGGTISYCSLTYKEKQIMEILSFVLGIAFVVVIATAIVAV